MTNNTCSTCKYWRKFEFENKGECYLNPPRPTPSGTMMRPRMKPDEWCGQFSAGSAPIKSKANVQTPGLAAKVHRMEKAQNSNRLT